MWLVNTLVKESLHEDMSNDAQHVYFLQKKKAEILARKNREKAGFEPSALLKYANDGSFLERFNKMMMQQQEETQKMQLKQKQLKQSMSEPQCSTSCSLSVDTIRLLSMKESEPVSTSTPILNKGYADEQQYGYAERVVNEVNVVNEMFDNKRKRKDISSTVNDGGHFLSNGNCNNSAPCKIQRFSSDELAKIIQVKKTYDELSENCKSKGTTKTPKVDNKKEKSRDIKSSQSKAEYRREEKDRSNRNRHTSSKVVDGREKTKSNHSPPSVKSTKETSKEKSKNDVTREKEKIPRQVSTRDAGTKKQRDRRKIEKKQLTQDKIVKEKQKKRTLSPVGTENTSPTVTNMEKCVSVDESISNENIELPLTSNCNETTFNNIDESDNVHVSSKSNDCTKTEINGSLSLHESTPSILEPVSNINFKIVKEGSPHVSSRSHDNDVEPVYFLVENSECCELALLELIPQYHFPGKICKDGSPLPIVEYADENDVIYCDYAGSYRSKRIYEKVKTVKDKG